MKKVSKSMLIRGISIASVTLATSGVTIMASEPYVMSSYGKLAYVNEGIVIDADDIKESLLDISELEDATAVLESENPQNLTFWYDEDRGVYMSDNDVMSSYGDAPARYVLKKRNDGTPVTFSSIEAGVNISGEMENWGNRSYTGENGAGIRLYNKDGSYNDLSIEEGYYNGSGKFYIAPLREQTNFDTSAGNVANGKTYWEDGSRITGTLPDFRGSLYNSSGKFHELVAGEIFTIPRGIYDGTNVITTKSLSSQTQGTATANYIIEGIKTWVNGLKVTGTMADRSSIVVADYENRNSRVNPTYYTTESFTSNKTPSNSTPSSQSTSNKYPQTSFPEGYYSAAKVKEIYDLGRDDAITNQLYSPNFTYHWHGVASGTTTNGSTVQNNKNTPGGDADGSFYKSGTIYSSLSSAQTSGPDTTATNSPGGCYGQKIYHKHTYNGSLSTKSVTSSQSFYMASSTGKCYTTATYHIHSSSSSGASVGTSQGTYTNSSYIQTSYTPTNGSPTSSGPNATKATVYARGCYTSPIYHSHTGNSTSGGGCYGTSHTVNVYHSHSSSCYHSHGDSCYHKHTFNGKERTWEHTDVNNSRGKNGKTNWTKKKAGCYTKLTKKESFGHCTSIIHKDCGGESSCNKNSNHGLMCDICGYVFVSSGRSIDDCHDDDAKYWGTKYTKNCSRYYPGCGKSTSSTNCGKTPSTLECGMTTSTIVGTKTTYSTNCGMSTSTVIAYTIGCGYSYNTNYGYRNSCGKENQVVAYQINCGYEKYTPKIWLTPKS